MSGPSTSDRDRSIGDHIGDIQENIDKITHRLWWLRGFLVGTVLGTALGTGIGGWMFYG